ncbi:phosphotransferase [Chitinophaga sp. Ak27]|uniref:phosphotransferase n=1 Tax=Chitinophaga sp. Ak27 TaxID=2726116 RepID=UPI00145EE807|nr:phosphotransferase [Chitinophaga sp. Ak27]NLU93295.1 phosphotransferase [Chitinophaga sp. Ak27]
MSLNYSNIFPADRVPAVTTALENAFGRAVISEAILLTGGLSAASVYKIIADNRPYVMKLDIPHAYTSADPFEKIARASAAGIAPPLHYKNEEAGIIISEFIENKPIRSFFSGEALAVKLAEAVKKIHMIPYAVPGGNLQETMDHLLAGFRRNNILSGPVPDECLRRYEEIKASYPWHDTDKVFSHNDLNPSNILCDGTAIWIIDWDTAFVNDRYLDLASVANFFIHGPEQEAAFLKTYFGEVNDYHISRFYVMRQISRIIYAVMMLQLAAQAKPADYAHDQQMEGVFLKDVGPLLGSGALSLATYEGQLMYGKALMNEAVQQMCTVRFEDALVLLKRHIMPTVR